MFIKEVVPKIIKNSRGEKTVALEIETYKGKFIASAPSGKSKGKHEVPDYNARGVEYSLKLLKVFAKKIQHKNFMIKNFEGLKEFESFIRKFEGRYGSLGANCVYALESCFLKASAKENRKELWEFVSDGKKPKIPMPVGNCMGGGLHSSGKKPDFQEFLLIPKEKSFAKAVTKMIHAYERARSLLKKNERKWRIKKNDEGAWQTSLTNEEVLEVLFQLGKEFKLRVGIDAAGSVFCNSNGYYHYENKRLVRDRREQIDYISRLIEKYKLFYVEDGLQEEDFSGFSELLSGAKNNALIVGDDLSVTNLVRIRRAVAGKSINAVIIKPNQIGSLWYVKKAVDFCKQNNIKIIFSHRSGETMDDALADYAVGFGADFIKCGIMGRERLIKLRRVMEIEKGLRG